MESPQDRRPKVLVIEDHVTLARLTARLIADTDCEVIGPARSVRDAMRLAEEDRPDLALVDLSLPDGSGADLIGRLRNMGIACAVVSAYARSDTGPDLLADVPWLEKPLTVEQLRKLMTDIGLR